MTPRKSRVLRFKGWLRADEQLLLLLCGEFVDVIVVLPAADFAVVFRCRLEQFVAAVGGEDLRALADCLHRIGGQRFEAEAIFRFCSRTPSESMPLIVVATGKLIA